MPAATPIPYQLRVFLRGVSPMIWRRLLVRSDSTIADLHYTFQIAFGWSDSHLHRFHIYGKDYGVGHRGGLSFDNEPETIYLADFQFRMRERFLYEYDFNDNWQHEVRVEQILPWEPQRTYPVCIGGKRSAPPEECGGVPAFLKGRLEAPWHARELLRKIVECAREKDETAVIDLVEEIPAVRKWLALDQFDCREVNRKLRRYANGERKWLFAQYLG
jgi:hypothetical protein